MIDVILQIIDKHGFPIAVAVWSMFREWRAVKKLTQVQDERVQDTKVLAEALGDNKETVVKMNLILDRLMENGNTHEKSK